MRCAALTLSCFLCLATPLASGCARGEKPQGHWRADTMNVLRQLAREVEALEPSREPAPTTMPDFVQWLSKTYGGRELHYRRDAAGALVDAWGEPVVLVSVDDRLIAVGSKGQDRTWQGGLGDDMVAFIESRVKVH